MKHAALGLYSLAVAVALTLGTPAAFPQAPGPAALREAADLLKKRLAQAPAEVDRAVIEEGVRALERLLPGPDGAADAEDLPPDFLKRFKGRAGYDRKTGILTLTYDFASPAQLADFETGAQKPAVRGGTLFVPLAEQVKHKVRFDTVTVRTHLAIGNITGRYVQTSGGYGVGTHPYNGFYVDLLNDAGDRAEGRYTNPYGGERVGLQLFHAAVLTVTPQKAAVQFGGLALGKALKKDAPKVGHVSLRGGDGGCAFGRTVIAGTVDPTWLRMALK